MKTKWFRHDLTGAPPIASGAGNLVAILNACLVDGFNQNAVDTLTYDSASGRCTLTVGAGHGFVQHQVIRVAGAAEPEYNGDFEVVEVIDATQLTYAPVTPPSAATATGTITVKAAPLDWTRPFAATNKAVYQAPAGLQQFLRLDDTSSDYCYVRAADSMTDVDTGTFWERPSSVWVHNALVDQWVLVGDDRRFYLSMSRQNYRTYSAIHFFGDFLTWRPADAGNCILTAEHTSSGYTGNAGCLTNSTVGGWIGDLYLDYTQTFTGRIAYVLSRHDNFIHPNSADNADHIIRSGEIIEDHPSASEHILRGYLPALFGCMNGRNPTHGTVFQIGARKFIAMSGKNGNLAVEIGTDWPVT